jgi:hypothetical protein
MTEVLNRLIDPNIRTVYNLGTAGYTLPLIIEGFQAALDEFPNSARDHDRNLTIERNRR